MKINQIILLVLFVSVSSPVLAYIDPGSGSAIMSAIIGFFVSITIVLKTYWYKIKSFFFKNNEENEKVKTKENAIGTNSEQ